MSITAPLAFETAEIESVMPYAHPFLFLDRATLQEKSAKGTYHIKGNEVALQGHFKHEPVFPASLSIEALGQLGVLFLLKSKHPNLNRKVDPKSIFFSSSDGIRCQRICRVGDTLALDLEVIRVRAPLIQFEGRITVEGNRAVFAEQITLVFDWIS